MLVGYYGRRVWLLAGGYFVLEHNVIHSSCVASHANSIVNTQLLTVAIPREPPILHLAVNPCSLLNSYRPQIFLVIAELEVSVEKGQTDGVVPWASATRRSRNKLWCGAGRVPSSISPPGLFLQWRPRDVPGVAQRYLATLVNFHFHGTGLHVKYLTLAQDCRPI